MTGKMKLYIGLSALALATFLVAGSIAACQQDLDGEERVAPAAGHPGFNLIFRYGVGAKNELNTSKGTYTKDMILDPSVTVRFSLTGEEMDRIYEKMTEIDFFSYPDEFAIVVPPGEGFRIVHPSSSYYFKVEYQSKVKELAWENKDFAILYEDERADKLRELIRLIIGIIESKKEYQKLPEPRGYYF